MKNEQLLLFDCEPESTKENDYFDKYDHVLRSLSDQWRASCDFWYGFTRQDSIPGCLDHNYRGRQEIYFELYKRFGKNILIRNVKRIKKALDAIEKKICLKHHNELPNRLA